MDPRIVEDYAQGAEQDRLAGWSLERLRTEQLLRRHVPAAPASVLDVGGGPGRYAGWLADLGYEVTLLDPVPLHVEQAVALAAGRFEARLGDARDLPFAAGTF